MELGQAYVKVTFPTRPNADISPDALAHHVRANLRYLGLALGSNRAAKERHLQAAAAMLAGSDEFTAATIAYARNEMNTIEYARHVNEAWNSREDS